MKFLKPAPLKQSYWKSIEKDIQNIFNDVYRGLFELIKGELQLYNEVSNLKQAILTSKIAYSDGEFFGKYSASITKELRAIGAVFDNTKKTWKLPQDNLPFDIRSALAIKASQNQKLSEQVLTKISNVDIYGIIKDNSLQVAYERVIGNMNFDIDKTIGIPITLTEEQKTIIAKEWTNNLDLYIKNFLQENITQLRQDIEQNTLSGNRAENLVKSIQSRYDVTKSKAKFLARQETSLLMSKMRETRYANAGIRKYKWSTSNDTRVRHRHKELDGKIYLFSSPPIVDKKGNRANPGEDFNCRCLAIPVVE